MSTPVRVHEGLCLDNLQKQFLRKCKFCGLETRTEDELSLFRMAQRSRYGRANTCKTCYTKLFNPKFRTSRNALWGDVMRTLNNLPQCLGCGESDLRALSIDHIHNDGIIDRDDPRRTYAKILELGEKALIDYQILCQNCNWIKHLENSGKNGCSQERLRALLKLSSVPTCQICHTSDLRVLDIDHISNNGHAESSSMLGKSQTYRNSAIYRKILHMSDRDARRDYQILCRNHNWIKRRMVRHECSN